MALGGCEGTSGYESNAVESPRSISAESFQMNFITVGRVRVSPPPLCVPTTQPVFIDRTTQNFEAKATTKVTLQEPPINRIV